MENDWFSPSEGDNLQGSLNPHCSPPIPHCADLNNYRSFIICDNQSLNPSSCQHCLPILSDHDIGHFSAEKWNKLNINEGMEIHHVNDEIFSLSESCKQCLPCGFRFKKKIF